MVGNCSDSHKTSLSHRFSVNLLTFHHELNQQGVAACPEFGPTMQAINAFKVNVKLMPEM